MAKNTCDLSLLDVVAQERHVENVTYEKLKCRSRLKRDILEVIPNTDSGVDAPFQKPYR